MLTISDWLAVATVALPLFIKALSDWQANAIANHNALLARVVGMASREAATIARALTQASASATQAGTPLTATKLESTLIEASAANIMREMGDSTVAVGASPMKVASIVQGEVNKLMPVTGAN
jgi:hypothetical protein